MLNKSYLKLTPQDHPQDNVKFITYALRYKFNVILFLILFAFIMMLRSVDSTILFFHAGSFVTI